MSDAGQGGARKRGWKAPALVLSLAVNLLFVGLIAGALWKRHHDQWRPRNVVLELSIKQMMSELPEQKWTAGEKALQDLRDQGPDTWERIRRLRGEAVEAMTADPYDEQAFADALAKVREAHGEKRSVRHQVVIDFVRNMTVDERRRFLDVYRESRRGPWDRNK